MGRAKKGDAGVIALEPIKERGIGLTFQDNIEFAHGCTLSIKIRNVLYQGRSKFQKIAILETEQLGRMLVLDGITMLTEFDEFAYHEMITHVPLLVHRRPSRVLVIGGGDGGVVREVLRHPEVESVHLCEIDKGVIEACRQYLPSLASSLDDPKIKIFYEDGAKFITKHRKSYEVIIVDSTDPMGPGQILFQKSFYENVRKALTPEGIAVFQCESLFLHRHVIEGVFTFAHKLFRKASYYYTQVPTYPSGMIGFFFGSSNRDPQKDISEERAKKLKGLKYYTPDIHRAAFALPRFAADYFQAK
jgi:spermidine synthase